MFLTTGGLTLAASSLLPGAGLAAAPAPAQSGLYRRINFLSDGLGFDPREYAVRLQEVVSREAVAADYYSNGGVIEKLEQTFARLLGKPAAMFVPTGTLANHLAVRRLAGNQRRVLVQSDSHFYSDSGDGAQTLSGLNVVPLATGKSAFTLDEVRFWVERSDGGRVRNDIGVIAIETPVRRHDHVMVDFAELERISRYAREKGIRLHLDGARLFTLPLHSGKPVQAYTALFDTVYVSLWKHFNGVSGAILAGSREFVDGLYHERRRFGSSLHEAWPVAAVAGDYAHSFEGDYARAWTAADELIGHLQASGRFTVRKLADGTSRFFLSTPGIAPATLAERALERDIVLPAPNAATGEFPLQVNPTLLRITPAELAQRFVASLAG